MAAIIAAILQIVGPILGDLLKSWLDKLLKRAEVKLAATGFTASETKMDDGARRLLEQALDMTPKLRVFRRALLRSMIAEVPPLVAAGAKKLPKATANELQALAANAEE